jgi:hyperosmotically inducible periplasmic protein
MMRHRFVGVGELILTPRTINMKIDHIQTSAIFLATAALFLPTMMTRASEMDDRIEMAATQSYVYKTYLNNDAIIVKSESGSVTLTGTVKEQFHKSLAADSVEALPGVKSVDNQLTLKEETPIDSADRWLRLKVETALLFHTDVNAMTTKVSAENGTITLRGEATDAEEKSLAAEYARDVEGVALVKNEMTLPAAPNPPHRTLSEKIDDASITTLVKASQLAHLSTSTITTKIETRDGVVTITGVAKSAQEKKQITRLASKTIGVEKVMNEMTVKDN